MHIPFLFLFIYLLLLFVYFFFWNLWREIVCVKLANFRWKSECVLGGVSKGSKKFITNITKKVEVQTTWSNKINPIF
jgi:hypothetical protein